mgnify:FL=1
MGSFRPYTLTNKKFAYNPVGVSWIALLLEFRRDQRGPIKPRCYSRVPISLRWGRRRGEEKIKNVVVRDERGRYGGLTHSDQI